MVNVEFTKVWKSYGPGVKAGFSDEQAKMLFEFGYAKPAEHQPVSKVIVETKPEDGKVKKKGK